MAETLVVETSKSIRPKKLLNNIYLNGWNVFPRMTWDGTVWWNWTNCTILRCALHSNFELSTVEKYKIVLMVNALLLFNLSQKKRLNYSVISFFQNNTLFLQFLQLKWLNIFDSPKVLKLYQLPSRPTSFLPYSLYFHFCNLDSIARWEQLFLEVFPNNCEL